MAREFWIREGTQLSAHHQKPECSDFVKAIHVIEYSAFEALEAKLIKMEKDESRKALLKDQSALVKETFDLRKACGELLKHANNMALELLEYASRYGDGVQSIPEEAKKKYAEWKKFLEEQK